MKKLDVIMFAVYFVAMAVLYFFWKCRLDFWFTVVALVFVAAATVGMILQHNKLKKLQKNEEEKA